MQTLGDPRVNSIPICLKVVLLSESTDLEVGKVHLPRTPDPLHPPDDPGFHIHPGVSSSLFTLAHCPSFALFCL